MTTVLQRICWNTRGWQMPSASAVHESGFPSEEGFGHEEWNFQIEDAFNDFVHGYIYTKPARIRDNDVFRVLFFAIHPDTRVRLAVGAYNAAQLIPASSYDPLFSFFERKKIFDRRATELRDASTTFSEQKALAEVKKSVSEHWLSVRCPVPAVKLLYPYPTLESLIGNHRYTDRFRRFTYLEDDDTSENFSDLAVRGYAGTEAQLVEDAYFRESPAKLKIILRRQNGLANSFCKWLHKHYGVTATKERYRVDVYFELNNCRVMAELKVCYGAGVTKSIREALGQLLEYNYYPSRVASDIWLILLDDEPSDSDKKFVETLREKWSLPLTIGWQSGQNFLFHPQWPVAVPHARRATRGVLSRIARAR